MLAINTWRLYENKYKNISIFGKILVSMYKVIIVDDESAVRERLYNQLINFKEDFEIVGQYENGYDALISGTQLSPDLLITDIKMPYIDGIELIKRMKQELPLLQSIIISGFDSFDYAKQAISLGVIGYISKPITLGELKETIAKAKEELDRRNSVGDDIEVLKKRADSGLKLMQNNDLSKLITLKDIPENFQDKLKADDINLDYNYTILGAIDFDDELGHVSYEKMELVSLYLEKYIKEEFEKTNVNFILFDNASEFGLFLLSNQPFKKEDLQEKLVRILAKIKRGCQTEMSIGLSEIKVKDLEHKSYRELYRHALRTLEYRTVIGSNIVIFFDDINDVIFQTEWDIDKDFDSFTHIIQDRETRFPEEYKGQETDVLARKLDDAIEFAVALAQRNYKFIVPMYRPQSNIIQLLMPIYLNGAYSKHPDFALVLGLYDGFDYHMGGLSVRDFGDGYGILVDLFDFRADLDSPSSLAFVVLRTVGIPSGRKVRQKLEIFSFENGYRCVDQFIEVVRENF